MDVCVSRVWRNKAWHSSLAPVDCDGETAGPRSTHWIYTRVIKDSLPASSRSILETSTLVVAGWGHLWPPVFSTMPKPHGLTSTQCCRAFERSVNMPPTSTSSPMVQRLCIEIELTCTSPLQRPSGKGLRPGGVTWKGCWISATPLKAVPGRWEFDSLSNYTYMSLETRHNKTYLVTCSLQLPAACYLAYSFLHTHTTRCGSFHNIRSLTMCS